MGSKFIFIIARLWVGLAFVGMGIDIFMQWTGVVDAFIDQLHLVECVANSLHCRLISWMHSAAGLFVGIGAGLSLVCGLLILAGYRVRSASLVLLCVIACQIIFLHPFWLLEGAERGAAVAFLWNAIVSAGALIFCMGYSKKTLNEPKEPRPPTHID